MASLKYAPTSGTEARIFGFHIADNTPATDTEFTIDSGQSFGQSFVTGSSVNDKTIKYVKIKASKVGSPTGDLTIKIVNGNPGSSVLGTLTIVAGELAAYPSFTVIEKALDTPLQVPANTTYGIEVSTTSAGANRYVIAGTTTNTYAGGSVWANTGSGWTNAFPNSDLYFVIRSAAIWFVSDGALGQVLVKDKDVLGGYDRIKCDITDPYGITHSNVWVSEQSGSNVVEYTEAGDSADKFRFYNMGIVDSGDTSLLTMKQEWENWYYVSTSGSDTNDGRTPATAWRTLGKGFGSIAAGENLRVLGGTYNESNVSISNSGTGSSPINIECDQITTLHASSGQNGVKIWSKQWITIKGLTVENANQGIDLYYSSNCHIISCYSNSNYRNINDVHLNQSTANTVEGCIFYNHIGLAPGAGNNIIKLNKFNSLNISASASNTNSIYWNRIKNKDVPVSQNWSALTPGGKVVGNYWYGMEANDPDNDCYGFVNLAGVDVYNQIVALGVAYANCKDSNGNSIASTQSKFRVNVGGVEKNVSIDGDSGFSPYNGDRDVYVHTTSDVKVLCILDPNPIDYTKFIVEGSAKITCKKNEW